MVVRLGHWVSPKQFSSVFIWLLDRLIFLKEIKVSKPVTLTIWLQERFKVWR
jgi:hypothetical protein